MKKISIILIIVFLISCVSAITIYSGDSVEIELEESYDYYSIVGNSSEVILDVVQNGNNVTITLDKYSQEDSYEIMFFNKDKEVITVYESSGGGTTTRWKTEYVDRDVIKEVEKEVIKEIEGETIEVEKIVNKSPLLMFVLLIIGFVILFLIIIKIKRQFYINRQKKVHGKYFNTDEYGKK